MAVDHQQIVYYLTLVLGSPGIIFNILTVIVLFKVKFHQIGCHLILLRSLAFADLMVCVLAVLKKTTKPHPDQDGSWSTCLFDSLFEQCSFPYTATFLTLVLIAVNQFIAITEALRYNQLVTGRHLRAAVALVWITSLLIHCIDIFRALIISQLSDENDDSFCNMLGEFKIWMKIAIPWKVFVALVGVGCMALSVIYIKIFIVARSSLKQSEAFSPDVNQQRKTKRNSLYTSLLLLGTFMLVYVPYCTVYATQEVYQSDLSAKRQYHDGAMANFNEQIRSYLEAALELMENADQSSPDLEAALKRWQNTTDQNSELQEMWNQSRSYLEAALIQLENADQNCHLQLEWSEVMYMKEEMNEAKQQQSEAMETMEAVKAQLRVITSYMESILLLNAICDPLIYMIKITVIRKVYAQMMCHFCKKTSADIQ